MRSVRVIERGGLREIVLPETKPETEWIDGRAVQKMSPTYAHARLQMTLGALVIAWLDSHDVGRAGTEWRFRVWPPDEDLVRPLVPDLSFISYEMLPRDIPDADLQLPLAAPTVAFEILSPGDRRRDLTSKIATLLSAGTRTVVVIDPKRRTVTLHDPAGVTVHEPPAVLAIGAMPDFALDLGAFFAVLDR